MSAEGFLKSAAAQIALIAEDIALELDEGLDHKSLYSAEVMFHFRGRVDTLLSDRESVDWDLNADDMEDKRFEKEAANEGYTVEEYSLMRDTDEDQQQELGL